MGLFNFGKKNKTEYKAHTVYAPMKGKYVALENVDDQVFSQKLMGDGFAIEPVDGKVVSPVSGTLVTVFPTKHAYGLTTADGEEVLIHIGIDTVSLNGKGFDCKVKQGSKVNVGDTLVNVDLNTVKSAGYPVTTMVIITSGQSFDVNKTGDLNPLDEVLVLK